MIHLDLLETAVALLHGLVDIREGSVLLLNALLAVVVEQEITGFARLWPEGWWFRALSEMGDF